MKKKKLVQKTLDFDLNVNQQDQLLQTYYEAFTPIVKQLWKEKNDGKNIHGGFKDQNWWHSRYSDFLSNTNSQVKDDADFQFRTKGWKLWPELWNTYKETFLTGNFKNL